MIASITVLWISDALSLMYGTGLVCVYYKRFDSSHSPGLFAHKECMKMIANRGLMQSC